jgi:hypothetical protein
LHLKEWRKTLLFIWNGLVSRRKCRSPSWTEGQSRLPGEEEKTQEWDGLRSSSSIKEKDTAFRRWTKAECYWSRHAKWAL